MKLLITIRFLGTGYCGWQKQKNCVTVQEKMTEAARLLFGFECDITGCSRTDSGVHANMFCATVAAKGADSISTTVPIDRIPRAFNNFLPEDIGVICAEWVDNDFHPRYSAIGKEYEYLIFDRAERDPFMSGRCWHIPHGFSEKDIQNMNSAVSALVGKHDFTSFMAQGSKIEDATRTIKYAYFEREGDVIRFRIAADGFLYNMVRIIVGTAVEVGEGKRPVNSISDIIASCDRKMAGRTAPASGLYLNKVFYNQAD
jgi:tRNA pseudouridine38-40 synthase